MRCIRVKAYAWFGEANVGIVAIDESLRIPWTRLSWRIVEESPASG